MKTWLIAFMLFSVVVGYSSASLALPVSNQTLFNRGNGMIYDSAQNLTWLRDANYAKTTGYYLQPLFEEFSGWTPELSQTVEYQQVYAEFLRDFKKGDYGNRRNLEGRMNLVVATEWADTLVYGGYDDWRLPTTSGFDPSCGEPILGGTSGLGCPNGELGYLYYVELGNTERDQPINSGPFKNIQQIGEYWTSSYFTDQSGDQWHLTFGFNGGGYQAMIMDYPVYLASGWAVRNGDVSHSHGVPEPSALILLSSGLAGVVALRRTLSAI